MRESTRLAMELAEVRAELARAARGEEVDDLDGLIERSEDLNTRWRAAVAAEGDGDGSAGGVDGAAGGGVELDGEARELARLSARARFSPFVSRAVGGGADVDGVEAELSAARGLSGDQIPWDVLAGEVEVREDAVSNSPDTVGASQSAILGRVFARSATRFLQCAMPMVGSGESVYPVLTGGAGGSTAAKSAAVDAEKATFGATKLSPKRASARYVIPIEDLALLQGMERSLTADLRMVLSDEVDQAVIAGDGAGASVSGFLGAGIAVPAAPQAVATFADVATLASDQVDGKHAGGYQDVRVLLGPESYRFAASTFSTDNNRTALAALEAMAGGVRVSANVPAAAGNVAAVLAARGTTGAVCPVWSGFRLIRDEASLAHKGQVALTAQMLYSFAIIRASEYVRLALKLK